MRRPARRRKALCSGASGGLLVPIKSIADWGACWAPVIVGDRIKRKWHTRASASFGSINRGWKSALRLVSVLSALRRCWPTLASPGQGAWLPLSSLACLLELVAGATGPQSGPSPGICLPLPARAPGNCCMAAWHEATPPLLQFPWFLPGEDSALPCSCCIVLGAWVQGGSGCLLLGHPGCRVILGASCSAVLGTE